MPDIDSIEAQIRDRLAEVERLLEPLQREAQQLMSIAATFQDEPSKAVQPHGPAAVKRARTPRKPRPSRTCTSSAAPSARRGRPPGSGTRARQALASIAERPGITAAELAQALGIVPNYLYRVLPRLQKDGKITKDGKGYHPAAPTP